MTTLAEYIEHFFDVSDSDNYIAESAFDCRLTEIQRYFPIMCISLEITEDATKHTVIKFHHTLTNEICYVKFFTDDDNSIENSYIEVSWRFVTPEITTIVEYD